MAADGDIVAAPRRHRLGGIAVDNVSDDANYDHGSPHKMPHNRALHQSAKGTVVGDDGFE